MRLETRQIDRGNGRTVSAVVAHPARPVTPPTTVVLAHGAGNDMRSAFMSAMHEGLAERGYTVVKFNFPYKELGRRAPDPAPVLEACFAQVIETLRADQQIGRQRMIIGGKSMGGRMATHLAARGVPVDGLLLLGYPLHPPGKPDKLRVAHLDKITAPMLFFAGTRDSLCRLDLLQRTIETLPAPVTLHVIDGGDHSFALPKSMHREPRAVMDEILETSEHWLAKLA